jgi:hypothetical protein
LVELQANYSNIKKLGAEVLVVLREEKEDPDDSGRQHRLYSLRELCCSAADKFEWQNRISLCPRPNGSSP